MLSWLGVVVIWLLMIGLFPRKTRTFAHTNKDGSADKRRKDNKETIERSGLGWVSYLLALPVAIVTTIVLIAPSEEYFLTPIVTPMVDAEGALGCVHFMELAGDERSRAIFADVMQKYDDQRLDNKAWRDLVRAELRTHAEDPEKTAQWTTYCTGILDAARQQRRLSEE